MTIAHRVSDNFAVAASGDGVVTDIDDKTGIITVKYDDLPMPVSGTLTVPYPVSQLETYKKSEHPFEIVIGASEIPNYPLGKTFSLSANMNAIVLTIEEGLTLQQIDPKLLATRKDLIQKVQKNTEVSLALVGLKCTGKVIPGDSQAYQFGERFTTVSGSQIRQDLVVNVTPGEKIKRGDILVYNKGFFEADPYSKQVGWKHGVMTTVALVETAETLEDGSVISKRLGEKLTMAPAHTKTITLTNDTALKQIVTLGEIVETTDPVCTFIEGDLDTLLNSGSEDTLNFLTSLEKKAPKAGYHGRIADIDIFYACSFDQLHPTLKVVAKQIEKRKRALAAALKGTVKENAIHVDAQVPVGVKYHGVEFTENTVVIEFVISEEIPCGVGDKCVIGAANKTVVSSVMEEQGYTQSGIAVDALYGCASAAARIVNSVYIMGIGNRVMRKAQDNIVDMYFN